MLAKKRLREDEAADGEEERNSSVSVGDQGGADGAINMADKVRMGVVADMAEENHRDGDKAQAIDLRNPISMRCDAA
jgi:hypothetical protein